MSFQLIKIDGFFRRVTERSSEAGGSRVQVIVGFRERRSGSSKSPGPGWRQVPGEKRSWMKREPRTEERFIQNEDIIESTEWPTGIEEHGFKAGQYESILKPSIDAGVEAAGAIGKRMMPEIKIETLETAIKEDGLAMPTAEEFAVMVKALWERDHKPKPRATISGSAAVTGRRPQTDAEKRAYAETARLADEEARKTAEMGDEAVDVESSGDSPKEIKLFPAEMLASVDPNSSDD